MPAQSNTPANRYGSIASEIYDIDKPVGGRADAAFHLERLKRIDGPILEPACGSGRFLIPLLEAGLNVAGFDASDEMLTQCRARCESLGLSPDLSRQRYEDFQYAQSFGAIALPVGSFNLVDSFDMALSVLRRFHDHLTEGGLLVLDVQPLSSLTARGDNRRSWTAANGDLLTLDNCRQRIDWLDQREVSHLRYERWREGRLVDVQLEPMAFRFWGLEELTMALEACGFGDVAVFGDYSRSHAARSNAQILTFEAIRRAVA